MNTENHKGRVIPGDHRTWSQYPCYGPGSGTEENQVLAQECFGLDLQAELSQAPRLGSNHWSIQRPAINSNNNIRCNVTKGIQWSNPL